MRFLKVLLLAVAFFHGLCFAELGDTLYPYLHPSCASIFTDTKAVDDTDKAYLSTFYEFRSIIEQLEDDAETASLFFEIKRALFSRQTTASDKVSTLSSLYGDSIYDYVNQIRSSAQRIHLLDQRIQNYYDGRGNTKLFVNQINGRQAIIDYLTSFERQRLSTNSQILESTQKSQSKIDSFVASKIKQRKFFRPMHGALVAGLGVASLSAGLGDQPSLGAILTAPLFGLLAINKDWGPGYYLEALKSWLPGKYGKQAVIDFENRMTHRATDLYQFLGMSRHLLVDDVFEPGSFEYFGQRTPLTDQSFHLLNQLKSFDELDYEILAQLQNDFVENWETGFSNSQYVFISDFILIQNSDDSEPTLLILQTISPIYDSNSQLSPPNGKGDKDLDAVRGFTPWFGKPPQAVKAEVPVRPKPF